MPNIYYADGSGFDGRVTEYAVTNNAGKILLRETFRHPFTNNDMEFESVIAALKICDDGDVIYSDSLLVVNALDTEKKLKHPWKIVKPNLIPRLQRALKILEKKKVHVLWKQREDNLAGRIFE